MWPDLQYGVQVWVHAGGDKSTRKQTKEGCEDDEAPNGKMYEE